MTTETVLIDPRIETARVPSAQTPMPMAQAALSSAQLAQSALPNGDATKSFMSVSNEYWLIGIIIVLVTVILMLIVYIVKVRQQQNAGAPSEANVPVRGADGSLITPPGARGPNQPPTEPMTDAQRQADLQALGEQRFVPRTSQHRPTIEPVDSEEQAQDQDQDQDQDFGGQSQPPPARERPSNARATPFVMRGDAALPPAHAAPQSVSQSVPQSAPSQPATPSTPAVSDSTPLAMPPASHETEVPPTQSKPRGRPRQKP